MTTATPAQARPRPGHLPSMTVLSQAVLVACLSMGLTIAPDTAHAQQAPAANAAKPYAIAAGTLDQALNAFGAQAGILIWIDTTRTQGKTSKGLNGQYTVESGLAALLSGSGLQAVKSDNGGYVLQTAAAEPSVTVGVLPTVAVTGEAERSATTDGTGSYAARGTTLFKGVQSLREIPQSVSVLTRQQMDDQNLTTVDAAVEQIAGVTVTGLAGEPVFWSRGYNMNAQIDGLQGSANTGRYASALPFLAMYDRIEVLRGVGGLLRGNGEPGGVINFVKKKPGRDASTSIRMEAGSWDHYYTELDVSRPLNDEGTLRGRAVVAYQNEHKFYDVATDQARLTYGVIEYDLTPATMLSVSAAYSRRDNTPFWGVPYYSDGSLPDRSSFVGYDNQMQTSQTDLGIKFEHRFDNDWTLKAGYNQIHLDRSYVIAYGTTAINKATGLGGYQSGNDRYNATERSFDINVSGPLQLFGRTHKLTVGYDRQDLDYTQGARWGSGSGWDMLNNHDFSTVIPATGNQTEYRTIRSGLYTTAQIKPIDDWTLMLGGRWSDYESKSRGITIPSNWTTSTAKANGKFTPFGGLLWDVTKRVTLYGSYAEIFEPQSDTDYTGQVLKPRIGWQAEFGTKAEFFDGRLNASMAVFRIRDENRSITDTQHTGCGTSGTGACVTGAGLWQSQGWEAEVSGSPAVGWDLSANYTRTMTKVLRAATADAEGQVANVKVPEHLFKVWTQYRPGTHILDGALDRWTFGAGLYATSRYGYSTTAPFQGGYTTVSAKAGYRISKQWDASLHVGNLFDKRYLERVGAVSTYNIYGKPRNFTLTLHGNF